MLKRFRGILLCTLKQYNIGDDGMTRIGDLLGRNIDQMNGIRLRSICALTEGRKGFARLRFDKMILRFVHRPLLAGE